MCKIADVQQLKQKKERQKMLLQEILRQEKEQQKLRQQKEQQILQQQKEQQMRQEMLRQQKEKKEREDVLLREILRQEKQREQKLCEQKLCEQKLCEQKQREQKYQRIHERLHPTSPGAHLHSMGLMDDDIESVCKLLPNTTRSLHLNGNLIGDAGAALLAGLLSRSRNIQNLYISGNKLTAVGESALKGVWTLTGRMSVLHL